MCESFTELFHLAVPPELAGVQMSPQHVQPLEVERDARGFGGRMG